jgi:hypothetical protein
MPVLTQLLRLTRLLRLSSTVDPYAPENTPAVELRTEDGIYLVTEDGNYIGVAPFGPMLLLWSTQALYWGDEPLTWSPV